MISLMALVIAFAAFFHRDLPRRGGIALTLMIGGLVAILFLQFLGGNVSGRFNIQGLSDEGRARGLPLDATDDCRPSMVWDRAGDLRVELPGLSQRQHLHVGYMGSRT